MTENISADDLQQVELLLGREPRGLEAVAVRDNQGVPMVIRVAPLVDGKPFPTLFWLIDKRLSYAIDQVEASGLIARLQKQVDDSVELQQQMREDHQAYIELRLSYMSPEQREAISASGFAAALEQRGIGGIADFQRIRCLHTYYAAHLVRPNTVGKLLDDYWSEAGVTFSHF